MPDAAAFLAWLAAGTDTTDVPVLILVAHPDDEVIGLGAQLSRLRGAVVLHVTDGAPRDGQDAARHGFADCAAYAAARRAELLAVLRLAGIGTERALCLGVPDQQAALRLPALARQIAAVVAAREPAVIITHAYEGGHPDHDAVAFGAHAAVRLLGKSRSPPLIEVSGYHAGPRGIAVGGFLPVPGCNPVTISLASEARARKRRMIDCFVTQRSVLAPFPLDRECLRRAPNYDFTQPPHPGTLYYESFPWGMTGAAFRERAARASVRLGGAP